MPQQRPSQLTLFAPELLWPDPDDRAVWDGLDCPALALLFARCRVTVSPRRSAERTLMELFGHTTDLACAPVRLLGEHGMFQDDVGRADWIAADPVHLRLEQERLVLAGGEMLDIDDEEAAALADALNSHFLDLGTFRAATPNRWYLQLAGGRSSDALLRLDSPTPSAVAGRSVESLLTELTEEREVRRFLNEAQTMLHAHPVNQQRDAAGRATINSLWLWGGGRLPQRTGTGMEFDTVYSADALVRGLARFNRMTELPPVDGADALFAAAPVQHALAILDDLSGPVQYEDGAGYRRALLDLESRWFRPAWRALADGRLGRLNLLAPCAFGRLNWEAGRSTTWRFWHPAKPLAQTVSMLAGTTRNQAKND